MTADYKILFLEDSPDDVGLMQRELSLAGIKYAARHVSTKEDFLTEFERFGPHIILADYSLPSFTGMDAFRLIKGNNVAFILVTGALSEQLAIDCMNEGIDDFIMKSSFKRLPSALLKAIDKKKAELQRDKMTNDLIQRNKDLEQFAYIVSHNLRGSVANILGLFNLWDPEKRNKHEQKYIYEGIRFSVKKLDDVISDLNYILQVKREVNENRETVVFANLIKDIKVGIYTMIKKEKARIKYTFDEAESILTIKSYLQSIFYNLIVNSIKYKKEEEDPLIEISSSIEKDMIVIRFKDNGMGIDMEKNGDKIFGLYKRFTEAQEGKGMGLFMVKTQVEALSGKIEVKSEPGKGSEFCIQLPLHATADSALPL
ncbi:MAG: sensor histidine kinase [Bacteroidia bacterium]